jgi:DNA-binding beta-propeller fold protein YncE
LRAGAVVWAIVLVAVAPAAYGEEPARPAARPVLPGPQPDGRVQLPNQWSLRPAGTHLELGDFPVNLAIHPGGRYLAALHAGNGEHEVILVDLQRRRIASRVVLEQTFCGLAWDPAGTRLYASGGEFEVVHQWQFADGLLTAPRAIPVADRNSTFVVAGIALDGQGRTLYAAGVLGDAVSIVPLDETHAPGPFRRVALEKMSYPYMVLPDPHSQRLFVSLWARSAVAVIDLTTGRVTAQWPTEQHPTEMLLSPDGKTLYVSCANSTKVSILDTEQGRGVETLHCALYPAAPTGNTPNSIALTPDGELLLVANADNNNLALFNVAQRGKSKPLGFIPVGWYPTCVRYNAADKRIYVANGKGTTPLPNPRGPQPGVPPAKTIQQYIGRLYRGTLGIIDLPTPQQMAAYSQAAYECSPLRSDLAVTAARDENNPIPAKVGNPSPIKHCIYIIKENRTYDQVFGDMPEGNGDPNLCLFPEAVTPNHHRLARQFVLLDNFYVESEVSADGHEWTTAAYCTDFVERIWPLTYRGSPTGKLRFYPSEGEKEHIARPAGGYIWERCREAGVSYRSYGEFIATSPSPDQPGRARVASLEGHFDPWFRGYDLDYPDVKRAERFIEELKRFEREGAMPQFIMLRLPNDHTYGTRVGKPTPRAMVADNDLALGMVVEAVTKSRFWPTTAIFVVEDDAQNGPDHVDAHRTVALVVSPYTKRGYVDSSLYSTSSMLRTMELILGLQPMSQFDAAARPMYQSFTAQADLTPYEHVRPKVDLDERNLASAWGAELSETFDLSREDAADDLLLNEVVWRSVKGPKSPMPAPVRAAFIFPHLDDEDDDDDEDDEDERRGTPRTQSPRPMSESQPVPDAGKPQRPNGAE